MSLHLLKTIFPHDTVYINVSSQPPREIIRHVQHCASRHDTKTIALQNGDVWRYGSDAELLDFLQNDGRTFYILTLGYQNRIISERIIEISWPYYWFNRPRNNPVFATDSDRPFAFSCLNHKINFHRLVLGWQLFRDQNLDQMIFSQHLTTLPGGCYENFMADIDGMHDYIATLPKTWPHDPTPTLIAGDNSITHPAYYQSYCNIVTESEVQDFLFSGAVIDLPTVTEKTYKPFRTRQLPIWLAAPGHLSYLESLGFEVMRDLLPAGFDQSGVFARATMISQIVSKGHAYIKDFYHAHLREIEHNYALVHGTQVDDLITNNIKNFLDQTVT